MQLRALIASKTRASSAAKQRSGQAYARMLGLTPGPSGKDDLIDGSGVVNGRFIYFQCKLSQYPLGAKYADEFYAGLEKYEAQIGVMLSGVGYTIGKNEGFLARLEGYPRIQQGIFRYHLLSLEDLYCESERFLRALEDLPPLQDLRDDSCQEE
ncbi:restriction endonuclease [Phormidium yuhuli AB48]|uniref:Restriction endonuclease n=1 Tax=Phormidium yuhuli AB48 TaxID=2940671 RepID=A0ABY5APD5_9CYAN|nr:restriction endonuclease [Phormidium yuhuli]USR90636.1 restriction endonuclease [Phormidium yuhuli AB48]